MTPERSTINATTLPSLYAAGYSLNQQFQASGFVLACFPGQSTCNEVASGFGQTGGIAVENSPGGNGPFEYLLVDQYVPGVDIMQGSLSGQITTGGTPEFLALNATRSDVFVADNQSLDVAEYTFPGGQLVRKFTPNSSGQIFGVATSPAGTYF